ncbi:MULTISPECIES: BMP family ABC transporter substrate-binding protein [Pseudorhizobium]|uniref:Simple sugar transport system substrate-binding protein n=3 Tax=Pseudorhizobium TaxID=1903858 RepID=A0A7W9Z0Y5_9HYPH|nr:MULTISPECIES: BMP family ABC transporter substrate-binding protein [Pseudorhizobium]CAD6609264.1 BMP family ABC transporter substrate-binding protein [arsenite-oxidising bacterium NT-25]CAD6615708.1 BMP family ABC transporter substrate-binding protein [Rhizobium sp. TCK]MBB6182020.1 simple sugar transport system substrate-binding protein [Pseudorhizobium flavum]CAD6606466.1 BMP family ABC transporter substrate-binding protein [Pseudorhizobium flavum]CAD7034771.1 BMP family ABC transporter s
MKKLIIALAASAALLGGFVSGAQAQDKTKVCFIYVGSKTDGGWTQAHDIGRQELQAHFGDKIETPFLENVPEGPDAERAIERMARSGCAMVFTTSFGFMDATIKVAEKFPDVKFEHATGFKAAENVATYNSRFYEGRYIQGQIAAKISEKGVAGYIASFPIPEVVMGINAFILGAQSVNPDFKLKVVWANTWFDPGKEADAAKALIDQGVDVLTQHTDTTAPMQVAAERGIKAFGQASDMIKAGPETQLTAIVDTWGAYYIKRTQALLDGNWKSEQIWDGLKDGILTMAPYTNMPDDVKAMAEETEAKIKSGELHPFTGPVKKQDGSDWLAEGEKAEDGALLGMNFYVAGVDDKLPQ